MLRRALFSADIAIRVACVVIYMLRLVGNQLAVVADMPMLFGILFPRRVYMIRFSLISANRTFRITVYFIAMLRPIYSSSTCSTYMPVKMTVIYPFLAGFMWRICSPVTADIAFFIAVIRVFMVCKFVNTVTDGTIAVMLAIKKSIFPSVFELVRYFSFVVTFIAYWRANIVVYMLCLVLLVTAYGTLMPVRFFI